MSQFEKYLTETKLRNTQNLMELREVPKFEQLIYLKMNVFEIKSFIDFLPININKTFSEEQTDLLLYKKHYCLITNLHNFCKKKEMYTHFCRRCVNTY